MVYPIKGNNVYNSKIAKTIGRWNKTKFNGYAITISKDKTLVSVSEEEYFKWLEWVGEEEYHKIQCERKGWFKFVYDNLKCNWFGDGYLKNPDEIEAKRAGIEYKQKYMNGGV